MMWFSFCVFLILLLLQTVMGSIRLQLTSVSKKSHTFATVHNSKCVTVFLKQTLHTSIKKSMDYWSFCQGDEIFNLAYQIWNYESYCFDEKNIFSQHLRFSFESKYYFYHSKNQTKGNEICFLPGCKYLIQNAKIGFVCIEIRTGN